MPDAFTSDQIAAIRELQSRRSTLDASQAAALDELAGRAGIGNSASQTVADIARQRLASRGLTPEMVKAGGGVAPLPGDTGSDVPVMRSIARGIGIPTSVDELKQSFMHALPNTILPGLSASMDMVNDVADGHVPVIGRAVEALAAPARAAVQNRPVNTNENANAISAAAGTIPALALASPTIRSAAGSVASKALGGISMPDAAANLINRYLGDGAIDTDLGKNAGRGISRAKIVAATAEGVQKGVQQSIADGQAVVKRLLDTPAAKAPTIDGIQLIRDAFGEPPLNITGATLGRWEEFAGNIAQKVHDISGGTGQLSPAQVDALKGDIDVQFGKLSADATELNLNQKAGGVRRAFDHAVDEKVAGYKEINDHLADLHHADSVLTEKIAQNATTKPLGLSTVADLVRSFVGTPMSAKGTRPGILTTPGRTGLAALLSEAPDLGGASTAPTAAPVTATWLDNTLRQYGANFIGPPKPKNFPRRPGMQPEFPATGDRDENDAMFIKRTDANGKPLQFPVPVPPSILLPPHFTNARNVRYGGPLANYAVPGEPYQPHAAGEIDAQGTRGLYGGTFNRSEVSDATHTPNNILIAKSDAVEPGTYAHEVSHAIYDKDLTPEQRQMFQARVASAVNALVNAGNVSGRARIKIASSIPESIDNHMEDYLGGDKSKDGLPDAANHEIFAELGAQYMLNPTAFRAKYPDWYGMFKEFYGGTEYVSRPSISDGHLKQNTP